MTKTLLSDYIKLYDSTLPPDRCQALIDRFEAAPPAQQDRKQADGSYSFVQLDVSRHWPDVEAEIGRILMKGLLQYRQALGLEDFWPPAPRSEAIRMKRYLPDGRDSFPPHVDVLDAADANRFITAILYLNDPGGGETVFPGLDVSIRPVPGRLAIFPPLWLFPHAGLPPRDRAKYILHGYLHYPPADPAAPGYPV